MISVIISVYNVENYINRAFDSLLNQSIGFENLEVIFIDDASTDNSAKIIGDYSKKYDNVKSIFLDKNSGSAGKPRNIGISASSKEFIMFLDPDDIWYEDACEILYDEITKEQCDIVSGVHTADGINVFPDLWINTLTDPESDSKSRWDKVNQMVDDNFELKVNTIDEYESIISNYCILSKIYRKAFLIDNDITFPENIVGEDSVFLLNAFLNASGIKFINKFIYYCSSPVEDASVSWDYSKERLLERLTAYFKMFYLSIDKYKSYIFKKYLLLNKLNYFTEFHLLESNLPVNDLLDVLEYAAPLYKLYINYNPNFNGKFSQLFKYIANKNYEDALRCIFKFNVSNQKKIKVATILDSFSHYSFKYEFDLIVLNPDSWKKQFESEKPDLFFCESAYLGLVTKKDYKSPWRRKICSMPNENNNQTLKEIIEYCRKKRIPSIFWNKEDPISQNDVTFNFIDISLEFDYIFTSCEESVENYRIKGHKNVYPLMFASQPMLFNPVMSDDRLKDTVVFAGSWYSKFPERCINMKLIFDKILDKNFGLKIYDRFSKIAAKDRTFPDEYMQYVNEGVDYMEIPNIYKESEFGLNFNTVTDSNTMFARRVFELMASNTVVLSNYSKGVHRLFKDNVLYLDRDDFDLNRNFDKIKEENLYNVLENHNYSNRFRQILDTINFKYIPDLKHVVLFYKLDNLNDLIRIQNHFHSINYPYKHLKLITGETNQFLSDSLLETDLQNLELKDNYYFCFADLELNPDFIKKALLHFSYIDENVGIREDNPKYVFDESADFKNVVFNGVNLGSVISDNVFTVYNI